MEPDDKINLNLDDIIDTTGDIIINLDNTYGATTTYWSGNTMTDITLDSSANNGTFTISSNTIDTTAIGAYSNDWIFTNNSISPNEVEKMCKEYPALEKVWRNFKSVYDMVKQDYEGKKKAGEIDDENELPF